MLIRATLLVRSACARRLLRLGPRDGVRWTSHSPRTDALQRIARSSCDVLFVEPHTARLSAADVVRVLRERPSPPEVIVVSDRDDAQEGAALLAAGCMASVHTGLGDEPLAAMLDSLLSRCRELQVNRSTARRATGRFSFEDFASSSTTMRDFLAVVKRVVQVDSPLLILGETGVGKEHLARAIHAEGPRRDGPFVPVNCGALPEALIEGELFGHEEGAFTGATHARRGSFELAHGGSLFLDEVGEMPAHLQVKLLRALQDGKIQPVGAEHEVDVDVRVIAATNRDLASEVAHKRFRADLFFRLNVVTLTVPPLRVRHEDVPSLIQSHVQSFCERFARAQLGVSDEAMRALIEYPWPGNVRELINVVERAVLLCDGGQIGMRDLPDPIGGARGASSPNRVFAGTDSELFALPLREASSRVLDGFERDYLERLLLDCAGKVGEAARRAGLSPRGLYGKLRRLGLAGAAPAEATGN